MRQDDIETSSAIADAVAGSGSGADQSEPNFTGKSLAAERWLLTKLLESIGSPPLHVTLWDGEEIAAGQAKPVGRIHIRDREALLKLATNPDLHFGEMYTAGRIEVRGSLVEFLEEVYRARSRAGTEGIWQKMLKQFYRPHRNTLSQSRDNIHHHYDIGNDFYRLWLDEQMVYTCAYFPSETTSLEQAQVAKLDHVARKLFLKPDETVVEAGCGWGALALHLARSYGVRVKAYNICKEQLAYARERAKYEGLDGRVEFIEDDYRNIRGQFDAFVSVGMLEHVGVNHFQELGQVIDQSLKADGRGLIHSIGRDQPGLMNQWIERRIFPGACPPSLSQMTEIFEPSRFSILDIENLRLHYARTLEHWLERYETVTGRVAEMFDDAFVRAWRLYLAGSIAAFAAGELQLYQVVFTRQGNNRIPWTRQHLYNN
jgi:cyclopropane-fatty-acyl-phospholipid synthase